MQIFFFTIFSNASSSVFKSGQGYKINHKFTQFGIDFVVLKKKSNTGLDGFELI